MPPRSVCLNVFTTSLGNGLVKKGTEVMVQEIEEKSGNAMTEERKRHDSLQEDSISATSSFPSSIPPTSLASSIDSATMNVTTMTSSVGGAVYPFFNATFPTICSTCTRPPPSGHSLLRCSRCKRAYYCSRTCQKQAWKGHKLDCDPISDRTSPSALHTPDASVPGSPAQTTDDQEFTLGSPINRDAISLCGAMHDSVYTTTTATN